MKRVFMIVFLGTSMIWGGMPRSLEESVENVNMLITNLPKPATKKQLSNLRFALMSCREKLNTSLKKSYDKDVEDKLIEIDLYIHFFEECENFFLGEEELRSSSVAKKWLETSYRFERILIR